MNVFILFLYSFEFFIISYSFEYLCEVLQKVHDARLVRYMPFGYCSSLANLSIPSSVTSIEDGAFANCDNLSSIYVSWETPLLIPYSVFDNKTKTECLLYVPKGALVSYLLADVWGDFKKNIVEYDATKVGNSVVDKEIKEVARYTANGQRLDTPTKGLNIVRYSDGSVRKELHN